MPSLLSRRHLLLAASTLGGLAALGVAPAHAEPATVEVVNATKATTCAEEDNVYVKLYGEGIRGMRIEALHPAYMDKVTVDSYAPDFSGCNFDGTSHPTDPKHKFMPKRVILWETADWLMVGNTYETFWRPDSVDFVVAGKVEKDIHLMQLYRKDASEPKLGRHQFLVLYPPDGYWRAKPLPVKHLNYGVYGTSYLVGPVEEAGRPVVELARVEFVPETMSFLLDFEDGSKGTLKISEVSDVRIAMDFLMDRALPAGKPLAAIRSMFVTADNSDVAEVQARETREGALETVPLMDWTRRRVADVRFGRTVLSRHNTSAPDMAFSRFER